MNYDIFCHYHTNICAAARCITLHIAVFNIAPLLNFRFSTCPMLCQLAGCKYKHTPPQCSFCSSSLLAPTPPKHWPLVPGPQSMSLSPTCCC